MSASALTRPTVHLELFDLAGALILQFILNRFDFLLNDLLHLGQVLGGDLVAGIENLFIGQFKDNGLLGSFAHLTLKQLLELLTFLDDGVKLFGNDFIVALFKAGALLLEIVQSCDRAWS